MKTRKFIALSLGSLLPFTLWGASAALAQSANDDAIKIYAAAAVKISLAAIAADFEQMTGNAVSVVFDSAGASQQGFLADVEAHLLITTPARLESSEAEGALQNGTAIELGTTVAGIAVPPGSPKPDISTTDALRDALLGARRIAFSDPSRGATVGNHFMGVIEALGVKDEVLAKATLAPNGIETMRLVLEEGVDIGITQTSEILQANRDALAGPFPGEFELATTYSLWHRNDASPRVRDFVARLLSPDGREELAAEGLAQPGN